MNTCTWVFIVLRADFDFLGVWDISRSSRKNSCLFSMCNPSQLVFGEIAGMMELRFSFLCHIGTCSHNLCVGLFVVDVLVVVHGCCERIIRIIWCTTLRSEEGLCLTYLLIGIKR